MNRQTIAKWFSMFVVMLLASVSTVMAQGLKIDDFSIKAGDTKVVTIDLVQQAGQTVYGLQTDLVLPEGLTLEAYAAVEGVMVKGDAAVAPTLSANTAIPRLIMLSMEGGEFKADATSVINLTLKAGDNFTGGEVKLTNSRLTISRQAGEIKVADATAQVTLATVVVPNYIVDFNKEISTKDHAFAVASNWRHIVDYLEYDDYGPEYVYVNYGYSSTAGQEESGALYAYSQKLSAQYTSDSKVAYDLLVTPLISGQITIDVKAMNYSDASLEVYALTEDGTVKGDLIKSFGIDELSQDAYTTVTFTLDAEQRVGLRLNRVYVDNFTAENATIIPEPKLTIVSVKKATQDNTVYFKQQADGTLLVEMNVTLQNNGEVNFVAGQTANYTLSVLQDYYGTKAGPFGAFDVPVSLAVGETSDPILVQVYVPADQVASLRSWGNWYVVENINGTQSADNVYAGYKAYEPKFVFRAAESTSTSSITTAEAWGVITESTTKNFEIANTGTAPLTIKSITLPAGFTSADAPTAEFVIASEEKQAISITQDATVYGTFVGTLSIVYLDKDGAEQTYTLDFSAKVINPNAWVADFNNETSTVKYPAGSIAQGGIDKDYQYISSNNYNNWIIGRTSSGYATENNMFITPKLHAVANDQLAFDVKGVYGDNYFAKVYVSTDRKNWGEPVAYYTYAETDGAEAIGSTWVTKTISFPTEGDYYVAFALYGKFGIDNIAGLEKVDVAHDLFIKEVKWPDASVKSGSALSRPSVDIIPLTDETADAYTVKYVCGETVLAEGTPVALTASANSSKTFSFAWTPAVETTTTYQGTKVVFDFGNGVTFETEPFDLTVTYEGIFHFVKSIPSSKWEPSDYTTPIAFGKTNEAATQTFYLYNWGAAPLTVNSITLPDGFTTAVEFPLTIAAMDESNLSASAQALEIAFSATEAGVYSGDMVITYAGDKTFTLPVSGTKLDATLFYANFDGVENGANWPAGSVYQSNISASNGGTYNAPNYYITSSNAKDNLFITPKLLAPGVGAWIDFDAKLYNSNWSEGKVTVYAAATREELMNVEEGTTRQQLFSVSGEDETSLMTADYQTFRVAVPAGEWFIGFEISGRPYVDEIYGLKVAEVAHDWMIASSNIPAEGMQNVASTATVNILNVGLQDEAGVTVTAFVDGEAVATATPDLLIPTSHKLSDAGSPVSISYRTPKVGTFPVYIKVEADNYSVQTEPVEVTFVEEAAKADATAEADGTSNNVPLNLSYYNSESVSLYTADVLTGAYGLANGAKIKSITYKGFKTADEHKSTVNVWYEWTDDAQASQPANGLYATEGLTQLVADKEITWEKKGSADELEDFLTLNFEEPLVYQEGKALRLVVRSNSTGWKAVSFEKSTSATAGLAWYHYNDTESTFNTNSWTSSVLPVLHMALAAEPATLAGTVTNGTNGIEGATITLVSADNDNVQYAGITDAQGAYSINVIQATRTYNVTVAAEGYKDATAVIEFAGESKTQDFVLESDVFQPVDCTALVPTDGWKSDIGSVGNYTKDVAQKEQYLTNTTTQGKVLYQTVEGLDNGTYTVELYANASYTAGRGFTSAALNGDLGRAQVYAGDVEKTIPVIHQVAVGENNIVKLENVVVSNGTLEMGLRKDIEGSNWHTIQIKSLVQTSNQAEADAAAQDVYWTGIAATILASEAYANVAGVERAALTAADNKAAVKAAIPPFYAARAGYDALAEIIAKGKDAMDLSEAEAMLAAPTTTGEAAAAKAAELLHPVNLAVNTKAVEGASEENPIATNFVINGTFDTKGVTAPWKTTTKAQNQTTANNQQGAFGVDNSYFFENWNGSAFTGKMYQEIEDIPNGNYVLKIAAFVNTFDASAQHVYANADQTPLTTGEPTAYEVKTVVTNNKIEVGLEQTVAVANWMGIDNVSLVYYGETNIEELVAAYEEALAAAQAVEGAMNAEVKAALDAAIATEVDKTNADALGEAAAALVDATTAAKASVAAYASAADKLPKMKQLTESTNVYTEEALDEYYTKWVAKYDARTLTTDEANALQDPFLVTDWHAAITADNFLLSAWDTNPDFQEAPYYINTWSVEGNNDGSEFKVPFFEYWTGDGNSLGERTLTATMNNLDPGIYEVTAWTRVRAKNGYQAPAYGITLQANDGEAVNVAAGQQVGESQFYLDHFTATGIVGADGVLKIKYIVAEDNNISWLSFKNVNFEWKGYAAGDANGDGVVTTADAVTTVSFALETEQPTKEQFKAADVNNSNDITVSDAVGIVNIALQVDEAVGARLDVDNNSNFLTLNGTELNLFNNVQFVGFQMDVTVADGALFNGVNLSDRAAGLRVVYNRIANNTYRVIAFSTNRTAIAANEGALCSFDITGNQTVTVNKIEFADAAANAYALAIAETTGIRGINADAEGTEIYTVGGVKNNKMRKGMNVVRQADGKVKKVFVK